MYDYLKYVMFDLLPKRYVRAVTAGDAGDITRANVDRFPVTAVLAASSVACTNRLGNRSFRSILIINNYEWKYQNYTLFSRMIRNEKINFKFFTLF